MRTTSRPAARVLAVFLVAAVLQACGGPEHRYVRTPEDVTGFKIPSAWEVFDGAELPAGATARPAGGSTQWLIGIDADPLPAVGHVLGSTGSPATEHPTGIARIDSFPVVEGATVPALELRNLILPIDALDADTEIPSDAVQLLAEEPVVRDGLRGVQFEYMVRESAIARARGADAEPAGDDPYVHVGQVAFVADASGVAFVLAFMCSTECYDRYRDDIQTAFDSWTVLPS